MANSKFVSILCPAILVGFGGARSGHPVSASAGDRCPTRWSRRRPLCGGRVRARQAPSAGPQSFSKTVAHVPRSHPVVERLIGTVRRECLDRMLFWTAVDLERKLLEFQRYYNEH